LESNPILEAFGNARTIRNDNSSRFGKFIELQFKHTGSLIGASIETYLLEKVRLIHQASDERNFHVFYEMLAAATPQERTQLFLENYTARDFKMTSQSGTYTRRDGVNDAQLFDKLVLAMRTLGFDPDIQMDIFTVVTAVLHASNLDFVAVTDDSSTVDEKNAHVQPFLQLLGLDKDNFKQAICGIDIEVGNKLYTRDVDKKLAEKHLEALVKSTYGAMFSYIVQSINKKIDYREQTKKMHGSTTAAFIGVLDIFGFESFPVNSFEQLCINYCNEALQQQFNLFVFKTEQEEYRREGIQWEFIDFPDNQDVIDLIDQKRTGILSILTDQCRAPRGTDGSFCDAMYKTCGSMPRFEATNLQRGHKQFTIVHYAGPVTYETDGFVEKNKDEIPRGASKLLKSSSKDFVKLLGMMMDDSAGASGGTSDSDSPRASAKKKRPTIASQFKMQLDELRTRVDSTMPHYIRCLKPNQSLMPNEFDKGMIASQLQNAGVLEAIRVSRVSYSQRFGHKVFVDRYRVIDVNNSATIESLVDSITAMVKSDDGER
jgi:myosin-5